MAEQTPVEVTNISLIEELEAKVVPGSTVAILD